MHQVVQSDGEWGLWSVLNTWLLLSLPHTFPLLQCGVHPTEYSPTQIAPVWILSVGFSPPETHCSRIPVDQGPWHGPWAMGHGEWHGAAPASPHRGALQPPASIWALMPQNCLVCDFFFLLNWHLGNHSYFQALQHIQHLANESAITSQT